MTKTHERYNKYEVVKDARGKVQLGFTTYKQVKGVSDLYGGPWSVKIGFPEMSSGFKTVEKIDILMKLEVAINTDDKTKRLELDQLVLDDKTLLKELLACGNPDWMTWTPGHHRFMSVLLKNDKKRKVYIYIHILQQMFSDYLFSSLLREILMLSKSSLLQINKRKPPPRVCYQQQITQ